MLNHIAALSKLLLATIITAFFILNTKIAHAAPEPTLSIDVDATVLLDSSFDIDVSLSNTTTTPGETGFQPMMEIILPEGISAGAASWTSPPGAPLTITTFGGDGVLAADYTNPTTGETISLNDNETLLIVDAPLGTLSFGQPGITLNIPATFNSNATIGATHDINGRGLFALGDKANGNRSPCGGSGDTICQSPSITSSTTPSFIVVQKITGGTVTTGPNFPRTFSITSNISTGVDIESVTISDTIPDTIIINNPPAADCSGGSFSVSPAPDTCTFTNDLNGGGSFSLTYATLTGVAGNDISISYSGYVQEFEDSNVSNPVISPTTGNTTTSSNNAVFQYSYDPDGLGAIPQPNINASASIDQRSIIFSKARAVTDNAPTGNSPGDIITWTITTTVSDFFAFDDIIFDDDIADGQTYVANSFSVQVIEEPGNNSTLNAARTDQSIFGAHLVVGTKNGTTGITHIDFDVSSAMADAAVFNLDDTLTGGGSSPSQLIISYQTSIDESFTEAPTPGSTTTVDGGDIISNQADLDAQVSGTTNRRSLSSSNSIEIAHFNTVTKTYEFKNGGVVDGFVSPNDEITFKISITIPTGDTENLVIQDYLPTPLFDATDPNADGLNKDFNLNQLAQGDTAPGAGEWRFTSSSTLTPSVTITQSSADNSVSFDFSDNVENSGSSASQIIEFMFTQRATFEPMADGLRLVNVTFAEAANSASESTVASAAGIIEIQTEQPTLSVSKDANSVISGIGSVSSGNFIDADAGDVLEFLVQIENTGSEDAFDVELSDDISSIDFIQPGGGFSLSVVDGGGTGSCLTGGFSDDSTATEIAFSGIQIEAGGICDVTYRVQIDSAAVLGDTISNLATVTYASQLGGTTFSPETDTADTTLTDVITVTKAYQNGTSSDPGTIDPKLRYGETADFLFTITVPEGTANNFIVQEEDSNTGNPSNNFFEDFATTDIAFGAAIEQNCVNANPALFNFVGLTDVCFTLDPSLAANQNKDNNTIYSIDFGTLTNFNTTDGSAETFTITITPKVQQNKAIGTYTNRANVLFDNTAGTVTATGSGTFEIVRASVGITKTSPTAAPLTIGDSVRYVVTLANSGEGPALNVADLVDTLPTGVSGASLVSATNGGIDVTGEASFSFVEAAGTLTVSVVDSSNNPEIAAGESFVVTYDLTVQGTNVADSTAGPGHPGGVVDGPGCVNSVANSADIASYDRGDNGEPGTVTNITARSVSHTLDSDGDGILNSVETVGTTCPDSDSDGVPDHLDTDSDDNAIADSTEFNSGADNDSDGTPDYRDTDDDNDLITDWVEIQNAGGLPTDDTDGDGSPDFRDTDSDNDGVADLSETNTDTDSDGKQNYIDLDSDTDGIPDLVEFGLGLCDDGTGLGTARDGTLHIDELAACSAPVCLASPCDSDGSGAIEADEFVGVVLPDADGDGTANAYDLDSDNDGLPDTAEAGLTSFDGNNDGSISDAEYALIDDGVATDIPGGDGNSVYDQDEVPDTDGDGIPDFAELDSDGDGINDILENGRDVCDANTSGQIDYPGEITGCGIVDTDGDGFLDETELALPDTDTDTVSDFQDLDTDNDGILDATETSSDFDGDGVANFRDIDADNDGILDNTEGQPEGSALVPNATDVDGDGISAAFDSNDAVFGGTALPVTNTDTLLQPDYLDSDSDDDGIFDLIEGDDSDFDGSNDSGATDGNNDGIIDPSEFPANDADGDGLHDIYDTFAGPHPTSNSIAADPALQNTDSPADSIRDWRDTDDDNDGVDTEDEPTGDADSDGRPNYLDTDSDNDGIPDGTECTDSPCEDTDGDGLVSMIDLDADGDGILDATETAVDTDGDGVGDFRDIDADNDGIPDLVEAQAEGAALRIPNDVDIDLDGIDSEFDSNDAVFGGPSTLTPVNSFGADAADHLDTDTDDDGIFDLIEGNDANANGVDDHGVTDADVNGIIDAADFNDADGDGLDDRYDNVTSNAANQIANPTGSNAALQNTDNPADTDRDWRDIDDDDDGIDTIDEATTDLDMDNRPDYLDTDSDGDGIPDGTECPGGPPCPDTDGDGIIDASDVDSDGDGVADISEGATDVDTDTKPNYLDLDSDSDGIPDLVEFGLGACDDGTGTGIARDGVLFPDEIAACSASVCISSPCDDDSSGAIEADEFTSAVLPNLDGDGSANAYDLDSDNDGLPDLAEAGLTSFDANNDGTIDDSEYATLDDGAGSDIPGGDTNGIYDYDEVTDTDNNGTPDFIELDSDGDGINDILENGRNICDSNTSGEIDYPGEITSCGIGDVDGDGFLDESELALPDTDDDGVVDFRDLDTDNDGILDSVEGSSDFDGDDIANFRDIDSDNDGITDLVEGQAEGSSLVPNTTDNDSDGVSAAFDSNDAVFGSTATIPTDTDGNVGENLADYLDVDSDDDGIFDLIEGHDNNSDGENDFGNIDLDNNGSIDLTLFADSDEDGLSNIYDTFSGPDAVSNSPGSSAALQNTDSPADAIRDWRDTDDDGDGINTVDETGDADGDGVPDYLETDSDGDGVPDGTECSGGAPCPDSDGDGVADTADLDSDNDGILDSVEGSGDSDGDGVPNNLDIDSDNDGIPDLVESQPEGALTLPNTTDADNDGISAAFDSNDAVYGGTGTTPTDTDGNVGENLADYLDLDSDDDGVFDLIEGNDNNSDGTEDGGTTDGNNDGRIDASEFPGNDADGDGLHDDFDTVTAPDEVNNPGGSDAALQNTDSSGNRDWRDSDDDGDGILTSDESADTDGDGTPDYLETDSDGDGIPDATECPTGAPCADSDGDGKPDFQDPVCSVFGSVKLPSGEAIANADIFDSGNNFITKTNTNGEFTIPNLGSGTYTFSIILRSGVQVGEFMVVADDENCGSAVNVVASFSLRSPIYFVWNSFYRQQNVVVAQNKGNNTINATMTLVDLNGVVLDQLNIRLAPNSERDFIVNALQGYSNDTYGHIKLEFDNPMDFDGHFAHYRLNNETDEIEFSIIKPFENIQFGNTYAAFNTMQPSFNPSAQINEIPNWIQIVNVDEGSSKSFTINLYDLSGNLITTSSIALAPRGRFDVQAGHTNPGQNNVGSVEIIPSDPNSGYLAQLYNYGADNQFATFAETFSYASGETAQNGSENSLVVPISTGGNGSNYLIVTNTESTTGVVDISFLDYGNNMSSQSSFAIAGKGQIHIDIQNAIGANTSGIAILRPRSGSKFAAKGMTYFRDPSGNVTSAYGTNARPIYVGDYSGAYNTFFGQFTWLKLFNTSTINAVVTVEVFNLNGGSLGSVDLSIPAMRGIEQELNANLGFGLPSNTYGRFEVRSDIPGVIHTEVLRVKPSIFSPLVIDNAASLPVR